MYVGKILSMFTNIPKVLPLRRSAHLIIKSFFVVFKVLLTLSFKLISFNLLLIQAHSLMSLFKSIRQLFIIIIKPISSHLFFRSTSAIECVICYSKHICYSSLKSFPHRGMIFHPCSFVRVCKLVKIFIL
nr:MAG TPA: hypothetical protein [Caudoviricetes sp.]